MTSAVLAGSAVAAALATAMVVRGSGGWASLAWVPLCLVAGALHSVINVRLARRVWSRRVIALSLTSSALFLLAFFLQVDVGDGPSWIVGSAWFERAGGVRIWLPRWWQGWWNFAAFIPLVVAWVVMVRETGRG